METATININMDEEFLKETEVESTKKYAEMGDDYKGRSWENLSLTQLDWNFDDGELYISGNLEETGFLSISFTVPTEMLVSMLEHSVKQMNKIKNVLEAVK